jgi:hypothetical protein
MAQADFDAPTFLRELDRHPELKGSRVVLYDGSRLTVLREGPVYCEERQRAVVVKVGVLDVALRSAAVAERHDQRLYGELLNTGLSCSAAVVGWLVVLTGAGAAPMTGGTSMIVSKIALAGSVASTLQCVNAGVRLYNETHEPEDNDWLDSHAWYTATSDALDVLALAGVAISGAASLQMVRVAQRTTGKSLVAVLKGLSRQERRRLTEEIIRSQNRGISNGRLKAMIRAGIYPSRYTGLQVSEGVRRQLMDALGASISFAGSATGGLVGKAISASGSVSSPQYAVGFAQAFETM